MHKHGGQSFAVNSESKFLQMKWQNGQDISRDTFLGKQKISKHQVAKRKLLVERFSFFMQTDSKNIESFLNNWRKIQLHIANILHIF